MTRATVRRQITLSLASLVTALAVVACDRSPVSPTIGPATAGAGGDRSAQELPWRIDATVAVTPAPAPAGCLVYFTSVIEGTATHLGRFTGVGSTCVTSQVAPDPTPPFTPAGPAPYATATFTNPLWTLTAANGDELWLEGPGATAVISLADNSLKGIGTMEIIGGTGRFAGATGHADVGAVNDDGMGPDDFSGRGWIRFQ